MTSGAPRTARDATEPPISPTSMPSSSAMRADMGSKTELACTHLSPARISPRRARPCSMEVIAHPGSGAYVQMLHRRRVARELGTWAPSIELGMKLDPGVFIGCVGE